MKYIKKSVLIGLACIAVKPINNNLMAAVSSQNRSESVTNYYDYEMLKHIEDSLKSIDPRNSIEPELGGYVNGKICFEVNIYSATQPGDLENVRTRKMERDNNRLIVNSIDLANVIAPCAYIDDVFIGVRHLNDQTDPLYTIINISKPDSQFVRYAFTTVD